MPVILKSGTDSDGNLSRFADANTDETVVRMQTTNLDDDFLGAGHAAGVPAAGSPALGYPWVKKIVGSGPPTIAIVSNAAGGVMQIALAATSEKEDAALYSNDQLTFDLTKSAIFEARIALSVLPTTLVEAVFGFQSAWIDGPDNATYYAQFEMLASGVVNMRTKDGVNTVSASSGVTLVASAYHNFRVDVTDPTNVSFFVDGVKTSSFGQFKFAATGSNAILQPYMSLYKASGTGVGTMLIDMVQASCNRV